ncbi:hypothetical protein O181_057366 [Austropuccinia psidii MF-1]|uniref:Uncharacterized protein n=1 Tax=Austropuccinia psidii MF-1 TaxID=1389203 RepID=A0A9Q3E874_9BASI|nr:hypothetical protein [Austropuccinia psidii MF-1]
MDNGQQEIQPSIKLGRTWSRLPEDMSPRDTLERAYGSSQRLESQQEVETTGGKGSQDNRESTNIKAIEEQLYHTMNTLIASGLQGVKPTYSPLPSHHSGTKRSVPKSNHSSQFQVVSRRRQGSKGQNKTSFNQRKKEYDTIIHKLLDWVKEVKQSQKQL